MKMILKCLSNPYLRVFKIFFHLLCVSFFKNIFIKKKLGPYGEFYFNIQYFLSDFNKWALSEKNNGMSLLYKLSKQNKCIFDIGSHIGLTTLPMSNQNNFIHSFDISQTNCNILKKNLKKNNIFNVIVNNICMSNNFKTVSIFDSFFSNPNNQVYFNKKKKFTRKINIKSTTVDQYVRDFNLKPDLIKIDVEGFEYFVLEGAKTTIRENNPIIILSYHPNLLLKNGITEKKFFNLTDSLKLKIKSINGEIPKKMLHNDYILQK